MLAVCISSLQTTYGDIEFGFYPSVAPKTVEHIFKLVRLGGYNSNHFFRVDKGFVAQVADVVGGREAPLNAEQLKEGEKTIVGEFSDVKHVRGILSMGRIKRGLDCIQETKQNHTLHVGYLSLIFDPWPSHRSITLVAAETSRLLPNVYRLSVAVPITVSLTQIATRHEPVAAPDQANTKSTSNVDT
eukprot:Gb_30419 [translate_table: standard]